MNQDVQPRGIDSLRSFQFGLGSLLLVVSIAAVLLWLWPRSFSPFGHAVLALWVALTLGYFGCAGRTLIDFSKNATTYSPREIVRHYTAFTLAVLAGVAPTACLGFFRLVFGSGGSNVAQLAGPGGMDLWSIWFHAWLPLWFFSPASAVVLFVTFIWYFRPRKDPAFFVMRVCGLASALMSTWVVLTYFPDA